MIGKVVFSSDSDITGIGKVGLTCDREDITVLGKDAFNSDTLFRVW